jgi:hypothetical protein
MDAGVRRERGAEKTFRIGWNDEVSFMMGF